MHSSKVLRAKKREYYKKNIEKMKMARKEDYTKTAGDRKKKFKLYYQENKKHIKKTSRASSKASYRLAPEKKKAASRATSKARYQQNPAKKRLASKTQYKKNAAKKNSSTRAYYSRNKESLCASRRDRYVLSEPTLIQKKAYMKELQSKLLADAEAKSKLIESFKKQQTVVKRVTGKAVCSVAAKRLVTKALQVCKEHAGSLLKTVRTVQSMQIKGAEDFGEGCHTASTEPYFYDSAYEPVKRDYALIANRQKLKVCVGQ